MADARAVALEEHRRVVAWFLDAVASVRETTWHVPPAPARWSAAALTLHVADSYQYGEDAAHGRATMRLRVPRAVAWFTRTVLLPRLLASERFPRGARAPEEVVPDRTLAASMSKKDLCARLQRSADAAASALLDAHDHRPATRVVHANFGPLPPLLALRLLSAHTRHHTQGIRERASGAMGAP